MASPRLSLGDSPVCERSLLLPRADKQPRRRGGLRPDERAFQVKALLDPRRADALLGRVGAGDEPMVLRLCGDGLKGLKDRRRPARPVYVRHIDGPVEGALRRLQRKNQADRFYPRKLRYVRCGLSDSLVCAPPHARPCGLRHLRLLGRHTLAGSIQPCGEIRKERRNGDVCPACAGGRPRLRLRPRPCRCGLGSI